MKTLKEFTNLHEGFSLYFKIIYLDFISFLKDEYNITETIKLKAQPKRKVAVGDVNLGEMMSGIFNITTKGDRGVSVTLINIAHEMTHIKQFLRGELGASESGTHITWKNKMYISVEDYNSITYTKYKNLPWEKEAIEQSKSLFKQYEVSGRIDLLTGKNNTLDYLISNDLVFV